MRITGKGSAKGLSAVTGKGGKAAPASAGERAGAAAPGLQSEALQPALDAMAGMPDIDHAKVAQLRDAIARGEMSFNATRLAALIQRYHGNHD